MPILRHMAQAQDDPFGWLKQEPVSIGEVRSGFDKLTPLDT